MDEDGKSQNININCEDATDCDGRISDIGTKSGDCDDKYGADLPAFNGEAETSDINDVKRAAGDNAENSDAKAGECVAIERVPAKSKSHKDDGKLQKPDDVQDGRKKQKKKSNIWWIKATIISLVLAAFFSFLSNLTASAEHMVVIILLLAFLILASILFDAIGVAVTSCDPTPIVSMASRKVYGARTALWLVKNSGTVSSICNDVIGDIFGIISGACSAAIVLKITVSLAETWQKWVSIGISAVVSALTIGGKAFMKNIAINNSKEFVMFVARLLAIFNRDERAARKKSKRSKDDAKKADKKKDNQ